MQRACLTFTPCCTLACASVCAVHCVSSTMVFLRCLETGGGGKQHGILPSHCEPIAQFATNACQSQDGGANVPSYCLSCGSTSCHLPSTTVTPGRSYHPSCRILASTSGCASTIVCERTALLSLLVLLVAVPLLLVVGAPPSLQLPLMREAMAVSIRPMPKPMLRMSPP